MVLVALAGAWSSGSMLRSFGDGMDSRFSVTLCSFRAPVMFAAGKGMRNVPFGQFPALDDFYGLRAPSFDTSLLPDDYKGDPVDNSFSLMHYHLMFAIGWAWRLLGVSHGSLHVLAAVLYTALMLMFYGLFRLGMGRGFSLGLVLWLSTSPALLAICPSIRDFSKAPFLVGVVLLLGWLVRQKRSAPVLIGCAAAAGAVAGIGLGFRQDLMLAAPLAVTTLLLAVPLSTERPARVRLAAVAVFLAVFLAAGWTPLRGTRMDKGSATAQAFVQGVSQDAEDRMDFGYASYVHHHSYSDSLDFTIVNTYARRMGDHTPMHGHFSAGHGQAGQRLIREYVRTFPGDMAGRGLSALWMLPKIPAHAENTFEATQGPNAGVLKDRMGWHASFTQVAASWGWPLLLAAVALLYMTNPRLALFLGGSFLFLGAYPSLLYEYRHFFYLAFLPYWAAGVFASQLVSIVRGFSREPDFGRRLFLRLGAFGGIVIAVAAAAMVFQAGARAWQDHGLSRLRAQYASAPLEACSHTVAERDGEVLIQPGVPLPNLEKTATLPAFEAAAEYFVAEFQNVPGPLTVTFVYDVDNPSANFTKKAVLPGGLFGEAGSGRLYFPVYQLVWPDSGAFLADGSPSPQRGQFLGLALSEEGAGAFQGLWRVRDGGAFRLWPFIIVPDEEAQFVPHKTGPFDRAIQWSLAQARRLFLRDHAAVARFYLYWARHTAEPDSWAEKAAAAIGVVPGPQERMHLWRSLLRIAPYNALVAGHDMAAAAQAATERGSREDSALLWLAAALWDPYRPDAMKRLAEALRQLPNAEIRASVLDTASVLAVREMHARVLFACMDPLDTDADAAVVAGTVREEAKGHPGDAVFAGQMLSQMADALGAGENWGEAAAVWEAARSLCPDMRWWQMRQGEALERAGKETDALEMYLDFLLSDKDGNTDNAASRMDAILLRRGDGAERTAFWRNVVRQRPDTALPLFHLALALEAEGDDAGAKVMYDAAISLDPSLKTPPPGQRE